MLWLGDDEQSDWVGDIGIAAGNSFNPLESGDSEKDKKMYYTIYQKFLIENFLQLPSEEKKSKVFSEKVRFRFITSKKY